MTPGSVVVGFLDAGEWAACFGLSYRDLCLADALGPQQIIRTNGKELRKITGAAGIAMGRNEVVSKFLDETDGEWLWFVDTDMGFQPDTVARLVKSADPDLRPVMGALCFCLQGQGAADMHAERNKIRPTLYGYVDTGDEVGFQAIPTYPLDQVAEVAGTGGACLLIHRTVLVTIRETSGDVWFDHIVHPTGNHGKPRTFSEDLSFCVRLASIGVPVHVDTAIKTTHFKGGIFLDEETYDAQQNAAALEAAVIEQSATLSAV